MRNLLVSTVLLYLAVVCYTTYAAPVSDESSSLIKRKSTQREVDEKSVAAQIRRLLQQRNKLERDVGKRRQSSFDDEDPLHVLLGGATKPRKSTPQARAIRSRKEDHRQVRERMTRFMEAIGLSSPSAYGLGSSSSYDNGYGSNSWGSSWGSSRSPYDEDDDDSDDYEDDASGDDENSGMQKI